MKNESVGAYCYDIALSKVQFSRDTTKFSPNNVRRLFISGDGVIVQFFVNTGSGYTNTGLFNPTKAFNCFCAKDFKPIIQCLTDLVCSNIEEIVFCTKSQNDVSLNQSELNLTAILKGYTGAMSTDLSKSLLGRFVRLRSVTFFDGTLSQVTSVEKTESFNGYDKMFADCLQNASLCRMQLLDNKDWYKSKRLRPQHYLLDGKGRLLGYFERVQNLIEERLKSNKISEINSERLGKKAETIKSYDDLASRLLCCIRRYIYCSEKTSFDATKLLVGITVPEMDYSELVSKDTLDVLSRAVVDKQTKESAEKYDVLCRSLALLVENCYKEILTSFLLAVSSYERRKITLHVKMKGFHASDIVVPTECNGLKKAEELLECHFTIGSSGSKALKTSSAQLLMYTCKLVIPYSQAKNKEVFSIRYWSDILFGKKGV